MIAILAAYETIVNMYFSTFLIRDTSTKQADARFLFQCGHNLFKISTSYFRRKISFWITVTATVLTHLFLQSENVVYFIYKSLHLIHLIRLIVD